jgi:2-haloacid dehalogenase
MTLDLAILDVNETLFSLDPVAARLGDVGLGGELDHWFTRILRDGIAAAAAGRFASFRDLAGHHLRTSFTARGQPVPPGAVEHVLGGFEQVVPHPDVEPGLRRLQHHGVAAVALTNGSASLVHGFLRRSGLEPLVAAVHDVAEVARWKPAPEPYHHVLEHHAVAPGRAALIAVHPWDVMGARSAGLIGAWLDRDGSAYPDAFGAPDVQARDLPTLVDTLVARTTSPA